MENEQELLTARQVAELKDVHLKSVYRAIKTGRLRAEGAKGVRLIRRGAANAWQPKSTREHQNARSNRLKEEMVAYLRSDETDQAARERLLALTGGGVALEKAARIREMQQRLAGATPSVDEYLDWKREEIEVEQRRDETHLG